MWGSKRNIMQSFFHRWIRVAKPLLHEMNPQHRAQQHRRATIPFVRVERLGQRFQTRPRHLHFHQEYGFAGFLSSFRQKARLGQAQLLHPFHLLNKHHDNGPIFSNHTA
jgi:hypothetical protein